jgi:malonyl-CoA/methylmalonyl-CoA synthetase
MMAAILSALSRRSAQPALSGVDEAGAATWSISGEELLSAIGAWQAFLRRSSVGPGDRVAIDLERGPALVAAHVAVLAHGACVVPINASLRPDERARVIERADLRAVIDGTQQPGRACAPVVTPPPRQAPALLIFTSGTTGEPKGVPLSLANLDANLAGLAETWQLSTEDRLLHALPAHHVHGLVLGLYGSLRLGMHVVLTPRFEATSCVAALAAQRATVLMGVPTMYHRLARLADVPALPDMRVFISGSAPLAPDDFAAFEARFGHRPLERYGLTETLIVASNPLDAERRPGTVGHPLPGTDIRIAEDGEIEVRSGAVMSGYWRDPSATTRAMRDGYFLTGDLGGHDASGYLVIRGRKKELIIVGGTNVTPGEVERALAGDPEVDELAVAGIPDADRGEVPAAFVVACGASDPGAIEARLRSRADVELASYKRPRVYAFVPALPRNAMGKIDRRALTRSVAEAATS